MPKPPLTDSDARLENDAIETMLAGLKLWRPDLDYPESHSDMQACLRGLLRMFELKRRPLPEPLKLKCGTCEGCRHLISLVDGHRYLKTCPNCGGCGYVLDLRNE